MQVKKQQLELDMKQQTGSKLGKEYIKAVYCHSAYLTYMQSTSCKMPGWFTHKLESSYVDDTTLMADESENTGLKLNVQKTKIMASGPITLWQLDGKTMETVTDFIFLGSKITGDGDFSCKIKRHLLLGRKAMTNLDSVLKSRDITLPTKVRLVKAMVFLVVMCACESWMLKKAEGQGIDAFELWCWRKLLRVPWTARKSNQSILKEINPINALKGLMLKLQYFGHLMQTVDSLEKALMLERLRAEGERSDRVCYGWMASQTPWT